MENHSPADTASDTPVTGSADGSVAGPGAERVEHQVRTARRRAAVDAGTRRGVAGDIAQAARALGQGAVMKATVAVLGFALEVAMVASFVFWGFQKDSPWDLIFGIGLPAVVVVLWGVFLAPRSERRLKATMVRWFALALFLLAAAALLLAGAQVLGILMAVFSIGQFIAAKYVDKTL